ncbi:MAG: prolyl oligopeptidase family serine peptidase [Chitinophagales bacterium]|nr:prolyl oligopeptidase family serine peptidase [Chitinophagales bacterium]
MKNIFYGITCFLLLQICLPTVMAKEKAVELIDRNTFFSEPALSQFQASPDGQYLTYVKTENDIEDIYLVMAQNKKVVKLTDSRQNKIMYYQWSKNGDKIIFVTKALNQYEVKLLKLDDKSFTNLKVETMTYSSAVPRFLHFSNTSGNDFFIGLKNQYGSNYNFYKCSVNGAMNIVREDYFAIEDYILDSKDKIRVLQVFDSKTMKESIVKTTGRFVSDTVFSSPMGEKIQILGWNTDDSRLFISVNREGKFKNLYALNIDSNFYQTVKSDEKLTDIKNVFFNTSKERLLGYQLDDERNSYWWKDNTLSKIYDTIGQILPAKNIEYLHFDTNAENIFLKVSSDKIIGDYYAFHIKDSKLTYLLSSVESLKQVEDKLNVSEKITFKSGGKNIDAKITYPNGKKKHLPLVVFLQDFQEEFKDNTFDREVQFLSNRGYAVFQIQYQKDLKDDFIKDIAQKIKEGVEVVLKQNTVDTKRIAIMGNGFGGFMAMVTSNLYPQLFASTISLSAYNQLWNFINHVPDQWTYLKYKTLHTFGERNAEQLQELSDTYSPFFHTENIEHPVLVIYGENESEIDTKDWKTTFKNLSDKGANIEVLRIKDEGKHFLLNISKTIKYSEIERFLNQTLGGNFQQTSSASFNDLVNNTKLKMSDIEATNAFISADSLPKIRRNIYSSWNSKTIYRTLIYHQDTIPQQLNISLVLRGDRWEIENSYQDNQSNEIGKEKVYMNLDFLPTYIETNIDGFTKQITFTKDTIYTLYHGKTEKTPVFYPYLVDVGGLELFLGALPLKKDFSLNIPLYDYTLENGFKRAQIKVIGEETIQYRDYYIVSMINVDDTDDKTIYWLGKENGVMLKAVKTIPSKGHLKIESKASN